MASRNLYLTYKKDTSQLLYWVINTSNGIVRSAASVEDCAGVTINTTGQSTVAEIVDMSKLIARHLQPIPSVIFNLFQAVIKARSVTHDAFERIVSLKPDPEIEKSNATHKFFIEALTEAFDALGGKVWTSNSSSRSQDEEMDEQYDLSVFQNQFSALSLGGGKSDDDSDAPSENDSNRSGLRPSKKKAASKGKKGKRGRKGKKKPAQNPPPNLPWLTFLSKAIASSKIKMVWCRSTF